MPRIEQDQITARFVVWKTFFIREILECGIPASADKHHLVRDLRILNSMLIVAMLLCPILGAFWASVASNGFVALYATSFAAWFATLLFLRQTKSPVVGGRLACMALFLLIIGSAYLLGGTSSFSLAWVMVMPVAAAVCVGKVDLWFWTGASSATVLGFQSISPAATRGGAVSDAAMQLGDPSSLSSLVAGVFVVAILTSVWHAFQSGLEKRLDASLRETQEEVRQKQILVDIATVSSSEESVEAASQLFAERLRSSFNLAGVRYWAVSREASRFRLVSAHPFTLQEEAEATENVRRCAAESMRIVDETQFETNVCVPVLEGDRVTGVMEVLGDTDSEAVVQYLGIVRQMALRLREVGLRESTAKAVWNEANQDHLTQLPNRRAFHSVLRNTLIDADREKRRAGLLFVDLNGFKRINDSLGHSAGDEVLRRVSRRLKSCLRLSDALCEAGIGSGPQLSRVGGDEFTILLDEIRYPEDAELVAKRALGALLEPIPLPDGQVQVGASIGIAIYPDDAETMDDLVRCADAAMYTAKRRGDSSFARHQELIDQVDELAFQSEFEAALANEEMEMHYQPIFSCEDGRLVAAEGLMRWVHPERGSIGPEFFVPLADRLGLSGGLGRIGFGQALKWFSETWEEFPEDFRLSLNLSPLQIEDTEFVTWFESAVPSFGLRYDQIEVEIAETALLTEPSPARANTERLAEIGVVIALDDFGTGQSSLSLLKRFPIGRIKLDRTFVAGLPDTVDHAAIASAVLSLADALDVPIVAEGVEDEAQQAFLAERGCDEMQGFLLGRPISGADFKARYGR